MSGMQEGSRHPRNRRLLPPDLQQRILKQSHIRPGLRVVPRIHPDQGLVGTKPFAPGSESQFERQCQSLVV